MFQWSTASTEFGRVTRFGAGGCVDITLMILPLDKFRIDTIIQRLVWMESHSNTMGNDSQVCGPWPQRQTNLESKEIQVLHR